ncbi:MAG: hypothetical protein J6S14_15250 [Clostridia bacterium]|nr:hypothetical protein [Clostridia bacterium]
MDKSTLSKHRYIYELYINRKNEVHIERYKVAYINKTSVWFIRGGDENLTGMRLRYVYDNIDEFDRYYSLTKFLDAAYQRVYLWERPSDTTYAELRKRKRKKAMKMLIEQKEKQLMNLQSQTEVLQNEIESLKNSPVYKGAAE